MIVPINKIKPNPKNPRTIKDERFEKLKKSIQDFPDMLNKRPLVCFTDTDGKFVVLGGNMRLKAAKDLGLKELPIILADEWTEEQKSEFLIKDNVGFGEWDWNELNNDWDTEQLNEWGLDVPKFAEPVDYSILDDEDLDSQLKDMAGGVKKAIQIEFEPDHYDEAFELVKFWRERNAYVGAMIMEYLKAEKEKL
jgi:ParB-like chromosome segregation protein Spo0J